jgi:trehalose-6-phosphatase
MEVSVLSTIHPYHAVPKPLLLFDHDGSIEWVSPHHQSRKTLINSEHIAMRAVQHQQS